MNWGALDLNILGPAMIAGLLVLTTHVYLGAQVLERGIVFIDLAIAQMAGLGIIVANAVGLADIETSSALGTLSVQIVAVSSALLGAALLTWTEKRAGSHQEALIGVLFILAACASLLVLASNPHGGEHLKELLAGQILWVNSKQLISLAVLSAFLLLFAKFGLLKRLGEFGFYASFALAVTASVQLVGVYLVFSSLIIPALATQGCAKNRQYLFAYLVGACAYAVGLVLSAIFDLPSGAVIVWTLAACGLIFFNIAETS